MKKSPLGVFETYLSLWVAVCMVIGVLIGRLFPGLVAFMDRWTLYQISIPVAISLWGLKSGTALATTVGVLTEVPVMLHLVSICKKTKHWFPSNWERTI